MAAIELSMLFEDNKRTPYFNYVFANAAKEYFKNKIDQYDKEGTFMRRTEVEGIRTEVIDKAKALYRAIFKNQLEKIDAEKENWKKEHADYYRQQTCLPSSSYVQTIIDEINNELDSRLKKFESDDINDLLDFAIQGYKAANEMLKNIPNSDLDKYCTEIRPMLNIEHKEDWTNFTASLPEKYGIPTEEEYIESIHLPVETIVKKRLSLNRKPCENGTAFGLYFDVCQKLVLSEE